MRRVRVLCRGWPAQRRRALREEPYRNAEVDLLATGTAGLPPKEGHTVTLASSRMTSTNLQLPQVEREVPLSSLALPGLLRCVVVSWSDLRGRLLKTAADEENWQAIVCQDAKQFIRSVFQLQVPLTIVDLPKSDAADYGALRAAADRACGANESLLMICGGGDHQDTAEELWARQLGVWTYLPLAADAAGLKFVFQEARKALAKQSSKYAEAEEYR